MGVIGGATSVRRVAYRLLNLFPPNQFKYKIFWVEGDQHVRGMFELHRKYGPGQIMELLAETQTISSEAGGSSSSAVGGTDVIPCSPIHVAAPEAAMQLEGNCEEDSDEDFVGDDGDTSESSDGSDTREAVQMAVKNYSIRRAAEYRVVESDPHKYICRCKLSALGCPWSIRVALWTNLGYWYVAIYC
ncbi:hypothetical protein PIB30_109178 [Stylosanthes scabra]|uniref:Transposase MuDR plant domain-containing protein n=1 Tax=Stylosanthes scabra TaxID=79078 RepID=A0ABU6SZX3_9FABA|nr:hypothetical protein [Stylosanthes scabra]